MFFSIIIPVFNRPGELSELLQSLTLQTKFDFEVIIIEDGSVIKSDQVVASFADRLNLQYVFQQNTGQGFARNNGMKLAKGQFFIILDSDVILPSLYLEALHKERAK